jgi:hypothetical protein
VFAPKVAKPQTNATEGPTSKLALKQSTLAGHGYSRSPIEQALFLQRTIGNQATLRLLAQRASCPDREIDLESMAISRERSGGLSWDFSKIPMSPPERASQVQPSLSSPTAGFAGVIQAKLQVGAVDDPLEHEADRVAEQVMHMPDAAAVAPPAATGDGMPGMQRKPAGPQVSRLGSSPTSSGMTAPPIVNEVLNSPGQPLDSATRAFMEPRFGRDFSSVRLHTDGAARNSAEDVGALAYTAGSHIVLREESPSHQLLAHELTHVVQQASAPREIPLQREPIPHSQPVEARLRVQIVETFEAESRRAIEALKDAVARGDRAYLEALGLPNNWVTSLLTGNNQFEMNFGNAAERVVDGVVTSHPLLREHMTKGLVGRVPQGVAKPDWYIDTASTRINTDLSTPAGVVKKLQQAAKRNSSRHTIPKGLNTTYEMPPRPGATHPPAAPHTPPASAVSTDASVVNPHPVPGAHQPAPRTVDPLTPGAATADVENTVTKVIVEEIPNVPPTLARKTASAIVGDLAKHPAAVLAKGAAKGFVIGIIANRISHEILHRGNQLEQDADSIDRANGIQPAERDDGPISYIPHPVAQIAAAIVTRVLEDALYAAAKARVENHAKKFQKDTGLTPDDPQYGTAYKDYVDMEQSMFEGDWDKYLQ